ncbi:hypothetical protein C0995_014962 [Termitomyces sp. Mi166|nr:hypothetical protein C0995_014962 [Termitomyces sp. Mi166\
MTKHKGYIQARLANFAGHAKCIVNDVIEQLSLKKKRKMDSNKENLKPWSPWVEDVNDDKSILAHHGLGYCQDTLIDDTISLSESSNSTMTASKSKPNGDVSDSGDEIRKGKLHEAPTEFQAAAALKDLKEKLQGPSKEKGGKYKAPNLDPFGRYCARTLRRLACAYIHDREVLPINPYENWNESMLVDEDIVNNINLYLQELGNNITAQKLVDYLAWPEVKEKHGISKPISLRTAQRYLHLLSYCFKPASKGQFADGHEHKDVVEC